jgi:hypothetical protein
MRTHQGTAKAEEKMDATKQPEHRSEVRSEHFLHQLHQAKQDQNQ